VQFLERDQPWYAQNRDLPDPPFGRTCLYTSVQDLKERFSSAVSSADLVIVGSYVPQGIAVGEWVMTTSSGITAFYDIDTPVTLAKLDCGELDYLSRALVMRYDLYLSFTGGPTLRQLEKKYYAPRARVLYCSVDTTQYYPDRQQTQWDLGYLGTYSMDRQAALDCLMFEPAREWREGRFCVAGSLYPDDIRWPDNVHRIEHLPPAKHRSFYNAQRWTLNATRADMVRAGYSPSVRIFEAAACGTPIISDRWTGIDTLFEVGSEILIADSSEEALAMIRDIPESERKRIGQRARRRVLADHTAESRAEQLEAYAVELVGTGASTKAAI
jgi:spore maturation protein CgeB